MPMKEAALGCSLLVLLSTLPLVRRSSELPAPLPHVTQSSTPPFSILLVRIRQIGLTCNGGLEGLNFQHTFSVIV